MRRRRSVVSVRPLGILKGRDRVEERRPAAELLLERVDVEPVVVLRDRHDLRPELAEDLQRPVVGGCLHKEAPLPGEVVGEEDEPLERAVRDENP